MKDQLQSLTEQVLSGTLDRADASACGQLLNVKLRAVEIERWIKETEELEARIEALERTRQIPARGGNRWGY